MFCIDNISNFALSKKVKVDSELFATAIRRAQPIFSFSYELCSLMPLGVRIFNSTQAGGGDPMQIIAQYLP